MLAGWCGVAARAGRPARGWVDHRRSRPWLWRVLGRGPTASRVRPCRGVPCGPGRLLRPFPCALGAWPRFRAFRGCFRAFSRPNRSFLAHLCPFLSAFGGFLRSPIAHPRRPRADQKVQRHEQQTQDHQVKLPRVGAEKLQDQRQRERDNCGECEHALSVAHTKRPPPRVVCTSR